MCLRWHERFYALNAVTLLADGVASLVPMKGSLKRWSLDEAKPPQKTPWQAAEGARLVPVHGRWLLSGTELHEARTV